MCNTLDSCVGYPVLYSLFFLNKFEENHDKHSHRWFSDQYWTWYVANICMYHMKLSVTLTIHCWLSGCQQNNNWKGRGRNQLWPNLRYCPIICLEGLRKKPWKTSDIVSIMAKIRTRYQSEGFLFDPTCSVCVQHLDQVCYQLVAV